MKLFKVLSLAICCIIISCQKDDLENITNNKNIHLEKELVVYSTAPIQGRGTTHKTESEIFENRMAWVTFITAKIIFENNNTFKNELIGLLDSEKRIPLSLLVGQENQFPYFNNRFVELLQGYIDDTTGCPGGEREQPDDFGINNTYSTELIISEDFLQYTLQENCIELYFPVGIKLGQIDIISVAHPLNNNSNGTTHVNEGIIRTQDIGCPETFQIYVHPNTISTNQNKTFIAAVPKRDISSFQCDYTEYSSIDFEMFLTGSW